MEIHRNCKLESVSAKKAISFITNFLTRPCVPAPAPCPAPAKGDVGLAAWEESTTFTAHGGPCARPSTGSRPNASLTRQVTCALGPTALEIYKIQNN